MGVDHNAYIGPYITATIEVKSQKSDKCENHNFPKDADFCPKCGTPKNNRYYTREVSSVPSDFTEDYIKKNDKGQKINFFDLLFYTSDPEVVIKDGKRTKTYIYLPNRYYKELNIPDVISEGDMPFDNLDIEGGTKKFKNLFADEITYLKQWFLVEIKFGYVAWYS